MMLTVRLTSRIANADISQSEHTLTHTRTHSRLMATTVTSTLSERLIISKWNDDTDNKHKRNRQVFFVSSVVHVSFVNAIRIHTIFVFSFSFRLFFATNYLPLLFEEQRKYLEGILCALFFDIFSSSAAPTKRIEWVFAKNLCETRNGLRIRAWVGTMCIIIIIIVRRMDDDVRWFFVNFIFSNLSLSFIDGKRLRDVALS